MASPSKAAYSERKRQKSTFILTVNSPVYPPIQGKENRLFLRPFIAAKETGGLDFLIAHALLIVCHSLFEVVIEQVFERYEVAQSALCILVFCDGYVADLFFREHKLEIVVHHHVLSPEAGQVFRDDAVDLASIYVSIIRLNEGRSKFIPDHPSSTYSSTTCRLLSAAYLRRIVRWVSMLTLSP